MGSDSNGMRCVPAGDRWLDVFALVIYIPDPLGEFLDQLRLDLMPGCNPHAHVSVLPPRTLEHGWEAACEQARNVVEGWAPFRIEATEVNLFPGTNVVYIEVGDGAGQLREMHRAMNSGVLGCTERFLYHPHITLAQEIPSEDVATVHQEAIRRWREYRGDRSFIADRAVFVRNTLNNCWIDLAAFSFGAVPVSLP